MEKAISAQYAVEELHQEIADIYQDIFDMTRTDYNNQLAVIEHDANMLEKSLRLSQTRGYLDSAEYYKELIDIENESISALNAELTDLTVAFQNAINSGEIEEDSESFYSMKLSILDVEEALADANIQLEEYAKTMRSIQWGYFDYAMDAFGQLQQEAIFLIGVMSNDKLFDDMGKFADKGTATMGLRVMNYNAYMKQADEYAKEMGNIDRELAKSPYDTELIERRRTLLDLQRQMIQAAESEKDAIKDLVSHGIQLELSALKDLIDEYESSLDSAKNLYDYQKKLSEKTGDIAKIFKQLTAYQGDDSEENRARIQKLQEDLKKAREDLEDTEYEQSINDQKKLLDSLYAEYKEHMNARLDNLEELVEQVVDGVNNNADVIRNEVVNAAGQVGYTITDGMSGVLRDGVYAYYDSIFTGVTSINGYLASINRKVENMVAVADAAAKARENHSDTYPISIGELLPGYATGGLANSTGLAMLHGTQSKPELVLNADDTEKFMAAAKLMRTPVLEALSNKPFDMRMISGSTFNYGDGGINVGDIHINIERVLDYNDMLSQMRDDRKFERLIRAIAVDPLVGKSTFGAKHTINFDR